MEAADAEELFGGVQGEGCARSSCGAAERVGIVVAVRSECDTDPRVEKAAAGGSVISKRR